ncbi:MAG: cysteine-rich CWC family protein [Rhodothermaceae bacterium]
MNEPLIKNCPNCNAEFECKVNDVENCQCYGVNLNEEQKEFIKENFGDCLCRKCLEDIKNNNFERK